MNRKPRKTDGAITDLLLVLPGQMALPHTRVDDVPREAPPKKTRKKRSRR